MSSHRKNIEKQFSSVKKANLSKLADDNDEDYTNFNTNEDDQYNQLIGQAKPKKRSEDFD